MSNLERVPEHEDTAREPKSFSHIVLLCVIVGLAVILICGIVVAVLLNRSDDESSEQPNNAEAEKISQLIQDIKNLDQECSYDCSEQILDNVDQIIEMEDTYESVFAVCRYGVEYSVDDIYAEYCDKARAMKQEQDDDDAGYGKLVWSSEDEE